MSGGKPAPSTDDSYKTVLKRLEEFIEKVTAHHEERLRMMYKLFENMLELYQLLRAPRPWAAVSEYQAKSDHWGE